MVLEDGAHTEIVDIASEERAEGDTGRVARLEMEVGVQAVEETEEVACQTERWDK